MKLDFSIFMIEEKEKERVNMSRRKRVQIDRDIEVVVVNFTSGVFFYEDPKTHNRYRMNEFGDEEYMTIDELTTMRNRHRAFLENMWIVIVDVLDDRYTVEDVVEFLRLESAYSNGLEADKVDQFIMQSEPGVFNRIAKHADTGLAKRIGERALELFRNGRLEDINKVYTISKITGNDNLIEDLQSDGEI